MNRQTLRRIPRRLMLMAKHVAAQPYKFLLGYALALGLRLNSFDFPPGQWPPPTPARRYIEHFLTLYKDHIRGRCVEFTPAIYRDRLLKDCKISSYDVWGLGPGEDITIIGDLQDASHLPDSIYDTIICTHVLSAIPKPWEAVSEMRRLLSSGGIVLCTNPVVLQKYAPHPLDCWRFTRDSMAILFSAFDKVEIHSFGNPATVAGSPYFLMTHHFPRSVIDRHHPESPSVIAVAAWK